MDLSIRTRSVAILVALCAWSGPVLAQPANLPTGSSTIYGFGDAGYFYLPAGVETATRTSITLTWETDIAWYYPPSAPPIPPDELDLRYSTSDPLASSDWVQWWEGAVQVQGEPLPGDPSNAANGYSYLIVSGLVPGRAYWFYMRSRSGAYWSGSMEGYPSGGGYSMSPLPDPEAPSAPQNLAVLDAGVDSIRLGWLAPGNDGSVGAAYRYELYRSAVDPAEYPDMPGWMADALRVGGEPVPAGYGIPQSMDVTGLEIGVTHWFVLLAFDEADQESPPSNAAAGFTDPNAGAGSENGASCGGSASGAAGCLIPMTILGALRLCGRAVEGGL